MHSKRVYWSSVLCVLLGACADVNGQPEDAEDVSEAADHLEQNLALGKPTTQSSTLYPFSAANAVDGNTDGYFSNGSVTHTGSDPQAWWKVDLGAVTDIGKVVLYNRTDGNTGGRLANFDVLLSNDGINWQIGASFPGIAQASAEFSIVGSGRFVMVRLRGTEVLSLAEVQVFAPTTVAYSPPQLANQNSNKCLVTRGFDNNSPVPQFSCIGFSDQRWHFEKTGATASGEAYYWLRNLNSGKCLLTRNYSTNANMALQHDCGGWADQYWFIDFQPGGYYFMLRNKESGMCLAVPGNADETQAIQSACNPGSLDQRWYLR